MRISAFHESWGANCARFESASDVVTQGANHLCGDSDNSVDKSLRCFLGQVVADASLD